MTQVAIVGSGIAAMAAALEAESRGASITVIRGWPGASALSSGGWDVGPWEDLVRKHPRHPYALLSLNESSRDVALFLERAITRLSSQLDLRLRGSLKKGMLLLNPLGGLKRTTFAPNSQSPGDFLEMRGARLLIIDFRGLPLFSGRQIASHLSHQVGRQDFACLSQVSFDSILLQEISGISGDLLPMAFASQLDQDDAIESLHKILLNACEKAEATHVALPPVIGLAKTNHIFSRLHETTGAVWFETLGVPPSVPGLRLQRSIGDFLASRGKKGWQIVEGKVVGVAYRGRRIVGLRVEAGDQSTDVAVDRLILATGRYVGGGIVREQTQGQALKESVLGLPVMIEGRSISRWTADRFLADHPLFSAGIRVNGAMQPLDDRGQLLYENAWAAGSVIGGYNPSVQHCGMGVAVGTGTLAGLQSVS